MKIMDSIRNRVINWLGVKDTENYERLEYINDNDKLKVQNINENKLWYLGDSNELLNYYTASERRGNHIYNRNRKNYFWALSSKECDIKRIHSGVPNVIINTLVSTLGEPKISIDNEELQEKLDYIIEKNDMETIKNESQVPLTLVEGYGAYKVLVDKELCDYPIIEYYEANDVEYIYKTGILLGIIFKDYYTYKNKDYILTETRRKDKTSSYIEYELFRINKNGEATKVELSTIPKLSDLADLVIPDFNEILAVPSKFFNDTVNKNYGRSVFSSGKIDLFDDLDQILSQDSQTVRVSTPVEYYPNDLLKRNAITGEVRLPKRYNRQYIGVDGLPDGDGNTNGTIQTTQPVLNFEQYSSNAKSKLDYILTGILSPATLGIDVAKKDNAEAQREKEKITIITRNKIIKKEIRIEERLYRLALIMQVYMDTGKVIDIQDKISIVYDEFANPSFENKLETLGTAYMNKQISTEKYVNMLYEDRLTEEERRKEIEWLEKNNQIEEGGFENEEPIREDYTEETDTEEETGDTEK